MIQPFVVQLENKPGQLARLTRALAVRGVDIRHIIGVGAGAQGAVFLTTDNPETTLEVLTSVGAHFIHGDVLMVEVPDRPGALADLTEKLAKDGVNLNGVLIVGHRGDRVEIAFSVDDGARARAALGPTVLVEVPHY